MALPNPLESFVWGRGGARKTPEQIAQEREIAEALLTQGVDTSPVGHWTQGLARVANAAAGAYGRHRTGQAEEQNAAESQKRIAAMLSGVAGGQTTQAAPVAAGGVPAPAMDYASQRVSGAHGDPAIRDGIIQTAQALGIDPVDLATAVSYETAGTFDPTKKGPTTQWGQHQGFIQFGEPQAREHGVNWDDPIGSQLGPNGAVASYLRKAGVQPGMGLLDIYSAINAGAPGLYNRSDANNGGAPGTVRDKVERQMAGHREKALALIGMGVPPAQAANEAMASGSMQAAPSGQATSLSANMIDPDMPMAGGGGQAVAQALMGGQQQTMPQQTAQATPSPVSGGMGGINPAIMEALSSPYASPQERQIAGVLLQQHMGQQQAEQERQRAAQEAELQMQQRLQAAQAAGVDPRFIGDDDIWKQATGAQFREQPTDIREYEYARGQGYEGTFAQFQQDQKRAGATSITNVLGGEQLTPGQKKIDEAFADTYLDWNAGGYADTAKQIEQLTESLSIIEKSARDGKPISGIIGALPDFVQPLLNEQGMIAREGIEEVVQRSLREILGAQFTEKEGERLIARAYNPRLKPEENAKRVSRLLTQIGSMASARQQMVDYFDEHGTLRGYKGKRPTKSELSALGLYDGEGEGGGNRTSSGIEWSIEE